MAKLKKGDTMVCVPCGREVAVGFAGISESTIWCCGRPMKKNAKTKKVSSIKKATKKKK